MESFHWIMSLVLGIRICNNEMSMDLPPSSSYRVNRWNRKNLGCPKTNQFKLRQAWRKNMGFISNEGLKQWKQDLTDDRRQWLNLIQVERFDLADKIENNEKLWGRTAIKNLIRSANSWRKVYWGCNPCFLEQLHATLRQYCQPNVYPIKKRCRGKGG